MKDYGLVSVITPSYNTAKFIAETIESVRAQTYTNWEIIVVDDCSTDNTDEAMAPYLDDPHIKYLKNPKNSGAAVSRNYALREAKGRWIAFLDSDDLWKPDKLERQLEFMSKNGYGFSCTWTTSMSEDGVPSGRITTRPRHIGKFGMKCYCWPGCLTVMYDAEKVGLVQIPDLGKNNDYAIWLKVIKKADCYSLPEVLSVYRNRKSSISHSASRLNYLKLIKHHYIMWRESEGKNPIVAAFWTAVNLMFGVIKKLFFCTNER